MSLRLGWSLVIAAGVLLGGWWFLSSETRIDKPAEAPTDEFIVMADPPSPFLGLDFSDYPDVIFRSNDSSLGRASLIERYVRAKAAGRGGSIPAMVEAQLDLAYDLLRTGQVDASLRQLEVALEADRMAPGTDEQRLRLLTDLAVAHLRRARDDNCVAMHCPDACVFPFRESAYYVRTAGLDTAVKYLEEILDLVPTSVQAIYLLNVANMAAGRWPEAVPERYRFPSDSLESRYDIGQFANIAPRLGLSKFDLSGGAITEDFDGDGFMDILCSTWNPAGEMSYFHNQGDGSFREWGDEAGLAGQLGGLNMMPADYDNDGFVDVLVLRGAWMNKLGQQRNSLLRNRGDGTFEDVTVAAGLAVPARPTQTAVWVDYDLDGDLDLYVGCESVRRGPMLIFPNQLFRNRGDGSFEDVAASAGVLNGYYCKGVTAGDVDGDGWPDLYLSNLDGPNRLYRNRGDGSFEDIAPRVGVGDAGSTFPTWLFDYDNDGWLDIFTGGYYHDQGMRLVAADMLGMKPPPLGWCRLYRNDSRGGFRDVTEEVGLGHPHLAMGSNFGDLDNDGFLDFYLGTGNPLFSSIVPNVMYRNDAGQRFVDVTSSGGFGNLQKGHGVAFGDLDNDGDQDIYQQMGGAYLGDEFFNTFYLNPGHGNRWLTIVLIGERSNRFGHGARVTIEVSDEEGTRRIHRQVGSGGSFGGSSLQLEVGLGAAQKIQSLEVVWPVRDARPQRLTGVPMDSVIEIREGQDQVRVLERKQLRF